VSRFIESKWMRSQNVGVARATLTREDSEWSRKFEEPGQEGWGRFFFKAASKGLPIPFDTTGWRCPKGRFTPRGSAKPP
jgi:hypothetical protein